MRLGEDTPQADLEGGTWHNSRTLWMVNPVIASLGPMTIRPDAPLTLRYRIVVHDGPTPTAIVDKLAAEFRGAK